jgi:shikimate kinase
VTPLVVLVGPPGAGKSTVGRVLASRFGTTFRDTDLDVEKTAGKRVSDIFFEQGEAEFRALEVVAVEAALREHDGVLAVGGVAGPPEVLKAGVVVGELGHELHDREPGFGGRSSRGVLPVGCDVSHLCHARSIADSLRCGDSYPVLCMSSPGTQPATSHSAAASDATSRTHVSVYGR